ncbi:aminotransferase class V-fold PLP-dependent enzyme [Chitinimonas sp.]|uniref:aminotransferase class V-fold PLP-dependent enzyme n=1 Tax=Chitinimonas sp. TaxID=1934313 RepID=UPI0035B25072
MHPDFIASNGIYLLNHSVGRPLRTVQADLAERFLTPWADAAGDPWGAWMGELQAFNQALATLLHGDAALFCPQTNLSSALGKVLSALPKRAGAQKILLSEHDFPSLGFVAEQAKRLGYELAWLPREADHTDPQAWADAMAPDVQWLLITQVQSNTGVQVPVAEIVAEAAQRDILTVVDVAQSVGILPIDLGEWNASFVIGSCVKWLCGGPGAGFLWVNPHLLGQCQPADVGWFSHENPFEFDIHHFAYHPSALRFWGGTPSVLPYVLASHSINYLSRHGIAQVRAHNLALTQRLIDGCAPAHIVSPHGAAQRSGTVIAHFGERQDAVIAALRAAQIRFDVRGLGLRLSPHLYNSVDDIDTLLGAIRSAL